MWETLIVQATRGHHSLSRVCQFQDGHDYLSLPCLPVHQLIRWPAARLVFQHAPEVTCHHPMPNSQASFSRARYLARIEPTKAVLVGDQPALPLVGFSRICKQACIVHVILHEHRAVPEPRFGFWQLLKLCLRYAGQERPSV